MSATLKDISKQSGFSVTTVSRALGGYNDVNEKTRQHIIKIANQLGYQPNHVARQLQGQRTQTIGFIVPMRQDFYEDDFFSLMLKGITVGATNFYYDVLTSVVHPDQSEIETYQRIVGGKRVDGVIIVRPEYNDERISYLTVNNIPFIVFGRYADNIPMIFPYVDVDNALAFNIIVNHLTDQGHQHIALILSPEQYTMSQYRYKGYRQGLQDANLPFRDEYVVYSDLTYQGGLDASAEILNHQPHITAIVCANDQMAIGAMKTVEAVGKIVGQDIAITGYDGIPEGQRTNTQLTTINVPIFDVGQQITTELIQNIEKKPEAVYQRIIVPELIVRESSIGKISP